METCVPLEKVPISGASNAAEGLKMSENLNFFPGDTTEGASVRATATRFGAAAFVLGTEANETLQTTALTMGSGPLLGIRADRNSSVAVHFTAISPDAGGGLTLRAMQAPDTPFVSVGLQAGAIVIASRSSKGAAAENRTLPFLGPSGWLRLVKTGPKVVVSYSADGSEWESTELRAKFPSRLYFCGVTGGEGNSGAMLFDSLTFGSPAAADGLNSADLRGGLPL